MAQEDKELLLKDLCARLPYGVKAILSEYHIDEFPYNGTYCDKVINLGICEGTINLLNHIEKYGIKPYLRPMSSMTEEEKRKYASFIGGQKPFDSDFSAYPKEYRFVYEHDVANYVEWLISHYFDYHGLIEKGLALEALEGMYNIKEK